MARVKTMCKAAALVANEEGSSSSYCLHCPPFYITCPGIDWWKHGHEFTFNIDQQGIGYKHIIYWNRLIIARIMRNILVEWVSVYMNESILVDSVFVTPETSKH